MESLQRMIRECLRKKEEFQKDLEKKKNRPGFCSKLILLLMTPNAEGYLPIDTGDLIPQVCLTQPQLAFTHKCAPVLEVGSVGDWQGVSG